MNESHISIPTRRGLKVSAISNAAGGTRKSPLVILLHGRTGWKEEEHIETLARLLSKKGIAAVRFDAPGSGESEGTWEKDYRVSAYIEALKDVYKFALENFPIDAERMGLWAHSMGGLVAIRAASELKIAAFCGCQITTRADFLPEHEIKAWETSGWYEESTGHFGPLRFPFGFYEDRLEQSRLASLKDVTASSLFIAGTCDDDVPAAQVRALYEAANEPRRYLEFEIGHDYKRNPEKLTEVNLVTVEFFRESLLESRGSRPISATSSI